MNVPRGAVNLKLIMLVAVITSIAAMAVIAAKSDRTRRPGVRFDMGCQGWEPLHCTRASFQQALATCADKNAYKVRHHTGNTGDQDLVDGQLSDACDPGHPTGVHSTQTVTFADVDGLKAFVKKLKKSP